jgi:hypothetical protein
LGVLDFDVDMDGSDLWSLKERVCSSTIDQATFFPYAQGGVQAGKESKKAELSCFLD